jgi:hypothetical protein
LGIALRVGTFTGFEDHPETQAYKEKCFIFLDGKQSFMPSKNWAMKARYTPGQVWRPEGVPRDDVNPIKNSFRECLSAFIQTCILEA